MRFRQRRAVRRSGFIITAETGYTLIEMVVALALFTIAAAVCSIMLKNLLNSYEHQCRTELASQMCRDVYRDLEGRLQNGTGFWISRENCHVLYFRDRQSGEQQAVKAEDFIPVAEDPFQLELNFTKTGEKKIEAEITVCHINKEEKKQILASRHLTIRDWGNVYEEF